MDSMSPRNFFAPIVDEPVWCDTEEDQQIGGQACQTETLRSDLDITTFSRPTPNEDLMENLANLNICNLTDSKECEAPEDEDEELSVNNAELY